MKGLKITLTLFFVVSTLLFSCEEDEFQCDPYFPYFKIHGLASINMKMSDIATNDWIPIEGFESVNWQEYFIRVAFKATYHASKKEGRSGGANLYALSCIESGDAGSKAGIDTLLVVTLHDYNQTYKANDTINNIVLLNNWTKYVEDYNDFFSLAQYIEENKNGVLAQMFELKLTEAPQEISSEQKFKIIYQLNTGDKFELTTKAVNLNK